MTRKSENTRTDIYARITDRIVTDLEKGVRRGRVDYVTPGVP